MVGWGPGAAYVSSPRQSGTKVIGSMGAPAAAGVSGSALGVARLVACVAIFAWLAGCVVIVVHAFGGGEAVDQRHLRRAPGWQRQGGDQADAGHHDGDPEGRLEGVHLGAQPRD